MSRRALLLIFVGWVIAAVAGGWYLLRTQPLPEGVNLDSPRQAIASFSHCLSVGHPAETIACVIQQDEQRLLAGRFAETVAAGLDPDDLTQLPLLSDDDADIVISGDTATVTPAGDADGRPSSFILRRIGNRWQVDLLATLDLSPAEASQYADRLGAAAALLEQPDD